MAYKLKYHPDVKISDIPKIDVKNRKMIKRAIEERLVIRPEIYGKPLQRTLKGFWKLRVGDYRVVFKASNDTVFIFSPSHPLSLPDLRLLTSVRSASLREIIFFFYNKKSLSSAYFACCSEAEIPIFGVEAKRRSRYRGPVGPEDRTGAVRYNSQ